MIKTVRLLIITTGVAIACALSAVRVEAAGNRTFVSALGNDENPCSLTLPCRTLQGAFNVTPAGGEINVLDPAGYGTLTITHSISIEGHGWAAVNPSGIGAAITINTVQGDSVVLRGLTIDGFGVGSNGIAANNNGGLVQILDCMIRNFTGSGIISIRPVGLPGTDFVTLVVLNSTISHNGTGFTIHDNTISFGRSSIVGNIGSAEVIQGAATIISFGDNQIRTNGDDSFVGTNFGTN